MNRFVFFLCLSAFPCVLFGQNVSARVAGLENDQKYMELLGREQQLHRMEDSVVRIIGDTRELFSSHSSPDEREKYGAEILRLEKELYEIRNRIGVTANEIGTIEQEFIVSNMNGSGPSGTVVGPKASGEQVRNLVYNAYFRDHLSAADYRSLLEAQQKETLPGRLIARYMSNYARLDSLAAQYAATSDRQQADEIYSRLSVVRSLNEAIGDSLAGVWGFIYDNKVYAYGYLLDKMGKTELLADFEARFRKKQASRSWPCRTALRRWRCTDIRCRSSSCFLMRRRWPICSALRLHRFVGKMYGRDVPPFVRNAGNRPGAQGVYRLLRHRADDAFGLQCPQSDS